MSPGYIYLLANSSYQGSLLKIGKTQRAPDERMQELSKATGVPGAFYLLYAEYTLDCNSVESIVHNTLAEAKHSKEFFLVDSDYAISVIQAVCSEVRVSRDFALADGIPKKITITKPSSEKKQNWLNRKKELETERMLNRQMMPEYKTVFEAKLCTKELPVLGPGGRKTFITSWFEHFGFFDTNESCCNEFMHFPLKIIQVSFFMG